MKKLLIALVAIIPMIAVSSQARMAHKWDEEHYKNGEFHVKKHDYPQTKKEMSPPQETGKDGPVKIDHMGRLYRESEFPPPRHSPEPK